MGRSEKDSQERRLSRIVESIPMGMHMYRLDERDRLVFVDANPAADRILGIDHRQFLGLALEEAFPGAAGSEVPQRYRDAARNGVPWKNSELHYNEGAIEGAFDVYAFQTAPGEMAAVFLDVTEQSRNAAALEAYRDGLERLVDQLTQEFRLAQDELVRNERLVVLGQLTASVAHELRNPLGILLTAVFQLRQVFPAPLEDRAERTLAIAERAIHRVDRLIGELLDFARSREPERVPTDLDPWLAQILDDQEQRPGVKRVVRLGCEQRLLIDRTQIQSAVINLLVNAQQALESAEERPDEPRVELATRAVGDWVEIAVTDNGPGIPDEVRERIFEPLFSTRSFGVGLGLPIAARVMETHGGEIRVGPSPTGGTTVLLRIPRAVEAVAARETDPTQKKPAAEPTPRSTRQDAGGDP